MLTNSSIIQIMKTVVPKKFSDIGTKIAGGSRGSIYSIGNDNKYAIKVVYFGKEYKKKQIEEFKKEVNIGKLKYARKFGVKIHFSYLYKNLFGFFVMDHFNYKHKNAKILSLKEYLTRMPQKGIINKNHHFWKMFKIKLINFYKYTKGYHGDLHGDNIIVLLNSTNNNILSNSNNILDVIIFDYGTHISFKFKKGILKKKLTNILKNITNNFYKRKASKMRLNVNNSSIKCKKFKASNSIYMRSNKNLIRRIFRHDPNYKSKLNKN